MYTDTPLIRSRFFPQRVFLKLENTQPSGSFKSRGISNLISKSKPKNGQPCKVFSSSGGNAGLAAAEAAQEENIPCMVVVPSSTKPRMRERIEKFGATVVVHGAIFKDADRYVREMVNLELQNNQLEPIYCHAFDNELIWEGHSTIVDEILSQFTVFMPNCTPEAIVLSCGGGGLYIGVMRGLERHGLAGKVKVFVVETEGSACFHDSVVNKKQVFLTQINTIATSLGSVYVPQVAVDYALKYGSQPVLVTDSEAVDAAARFASDHCFVVEPACSATMAALYTGKVDVMGPVVAIVCGGSSWSAEDIRIHSTS